MKNTAGLILLSLFLGLFAFAPDVAAQDEKTLEERLDEIDPSDPDQLCEVGMWASKHKSGKVRREGRKLLKEVLELDDEHAEARKALGHTKVGDKWYTSKKKAEKARLALLTESMLEKGYVKFRGGFIKKTAKRDFDRKTWQKDDELIWRSEDEIMRAKGYRKFQGVWLPMSAEDAARADKHRKSTGEDIIVISSAHYRFHMMTPPKFAQQYSKQIDALYEWFFDTFEADVFYKRDNNQVFGGRRPDIWCFNTQQQFQDWITTYQEEYQWTAEEKAEFRKARPGGYIMTGKQIIIAINEKAEDLENTLLHQNGILILQWFIQFVAPAWEREAFGHLCEQLHGTQKVGNTNNSSKSRYGANGDIAQKDFNTTDAPSSTKGIVKRGDHKTVSDLSRLPLNSLGLDELSQGYSHIEWMFNKNLKAMTKFFHTQRSNRPNVKAKTREDRLSAWLISSLYNGFGMDENEFMKAWSAYVKKNYR